MLTVKELKDVAAIWEYEDDASSWIRKNVAWAKGRVRELNASYKRNSILSRNLM